MITQTTSAMTSPSALAPTSSTSSPAASAARSAAAGGGETSTSRSASATWPERVLGSLLRTTRSRSSALARVALAVLIAPHGAQHALGWLGGYGFRGTHAWMTQTLGFPAPLAAFAIVTELVAPVALLLGVAGRAAAAGIIGLMLGAILTHASNGFFMNWFGALPAGQEGFEYHLMTIALAGVVVLEGSGCLSLDRLALATSRLSATAS